MIPIKYEVVGEEDYAFLIEIEDTGEYAVSGGTYTSQPPRTGRLTTAQEDELLASIEALGIPPEHPKPEEGKAFVAKLVIGAEGQAVTYPFWEGALEEDAKLRYLVRLLETL